MTIKNAQAFVDGQWDWAILKDCFGGKIEPSDIDGQIERNGFFLYLEAKSPNVKIPLGQEILMQNRVRDGISTYIIIWGEKNTPEKLRVYYPAPYVIPHDIYGGLDTLRDYCSRWYRYANKGDWRKAILLAAKSRAL